MVVMEDGTEGEIEMRGGRANRRIYVSQPDSESSSQHGSSCSMRGFVSGTCLTCPDVAWSFGRLLGGKGEP